MKTKLIKFTLDLNVWKKATALKKEKGWSWKDYIKELLKRCGK